jgi:hypothetical protein
MKGKASFVGEIVGATGFCLYLCFVCAFLKLRVFCSFELRSNLKFI